MEISHVMQEREEREEAPDLRTARGGGMGGRLRTDKICRQVPDLGPIKNDLKEVVFQIQAVF